MWRIFTVTLVVAALAAAAVWPWPSPEVDWRTPAESALSKGDCPAAIKILDAATGAGSQEAHDKLRSLVDGGQCNKQPVGEGAGNFYAFTSLYYGKPTDQIYGLARNDLGWGRHQVVAAMLALCAAPYNGASRIDHVKLAKMMPGAAGPIMSLHQLRREACLTFLEGVAGQLVDADDREANNVALLMVTYPPLNERPQSGVLDAKLTLEKDFVPSWGEGRETFFYKAAWRRLEWAADTGHIPAVRLMVRYLNDGRHRSRDAAAAYYWILRLRRLGEEHPLAQTIEAELSPKEREYNKHSEEWDWEFAHRQR